MPKFELRVAYRGSAAPEEKQFVEAGSMREAILKITEQSGGNEVALVTYAQYCVPEPRHVRLDHDIPFMLAPNPVA